jgi:hypothetical protein
MWQEFVDSRIDGPTRREQSHRLPPQLLDDLRGALILLHRTKLHRSRSYEGFAWPIIMGSGLDDGMYWHLHLRSLLITINYSGIANLLTSQITRVRYPLPSNGFIMGPITSNQYEVLPFPVALNSENSTQLSSNYCPVLLQQLPASEFASLITTLHGPNGKHSLYCWQSLFTVPFPSNRRPIVACSCVAGMRLAARCLTVDIHLTIYFPCHNKTINEQETKWKWSLAATQQTDG